MVSSPREQRAIGPGSAFGEPGREKSLGMMRHNCGV